MRGAYAKRRQLRKAQATLRNTDYADEHGPRTLRYARSALTLQKAVYVPLPIKTGRALLDGHDNHALLGEHVLHHSIMHFHVLANTHSAPVSPAKQKFVLRRISGILSFCVCVFATFAALGVLSRQTPMSIPNGALFFQLGFVGTAGALMIVGGLRLVMAFQISDDPILRRVGKGTECLLCVSGAVLMVGLFCTAAQLPIAQLFMKWGLLGGAVTLPLTGLMKLADVLMMDAPDGVSAGGETGPSDARAHRDHVRVTDPQERT